MTCLIHGYNAIDAAFFTAWNAIADDADRISSLCLQLPMQRIPQSAIACGRNPRQAQPPGRVGVNRSSAIAQSPWRIGSAPARAFALAVDAAREGDYDSITDLFRSERSAGTVSQDSSWRAPASSSARLICWAACMTRVGASSPSETFR